MLQILIFLLEKCNLNDAFTAWDTSRSRKDLPLKGLPIELPFRFQINLKALLSNYEWKLWISPRYNIFNRKRETAIWLLPEARKKESLWAWTQFVKVL